MTIGRLNAADRAAFVAAVGFAFEHSPWIAQKAWERRPFAGIQDLHDAMLGVVAAASPQERLALIAAHPDLAGRIAREGRLGESSSREQASAGLDRLGAEQMARFDELNAAYRARFGFPFVVCARAQTADAILAAMDRRLHNDREAEVDAALTEIGKIAYLRLAEAIS
ncbi:MAG: 2-oxo-4-hydroxy-4-carboxy-5-ureidoimidazoline decarboxylase [Candidatus Tyrphobacter sp.]